MRIGSSFIPFDLSDKLSSRETPWKPSPDLAEQFSPIPSNDSQNYRLYPVQRGPEYEFAIRYFFANKPLGFGVKKIDLIDNPTLKKSFEASLVTMNLQAKSPIFAPTWERDLKQTMQRKQVIEDWESSVSQFSPFKTSDGEIIDQAKILPLLHGSSLGKSKSICSTGFIYFGKHHFFNPQMGLTTLSTDQGYFGSGIYLTDDFEYAKKYSQDGVIFICWVAHRPPLPVVSDVKHPKKSSDMALLEGRERYLNHNMHLIPVAQVKGLVYYPCYEGQKAACKEYVVFDPPQVLPWMVLTLTPDTPERSIGAFYTVDEFFLAIQRGQFDQIKIWLEENKGRILDKNGMGETPLFPAVMGNQIALLEWLSKQNPSLLEIKREDNSSVLHFAMAGGFHDIAKWINNFSPQLMGDKNDRGDTPLYLAAFYEQKAILETFIEDVKKDPSIILKLAQTPHHETLVFLVGKGVPADVRNRQKQTPLHLAAQAGQPQNVEFLLEQGLQIDAVDQNGRSPLFLAVTQGQEKTVRLLLERGANPRLVATGGETVFHMAAFYGYLSILEMLIPVCPDLVNVPDDDGKTPLHKAVWGDPKSRVVDWLLTHGADSQSKTYNRLTKTAFNYTPLHWAAKHGHEESVMRLMLHGAKQDDTNINGETPFELALRFGHDRVAKLFIDPHFKGSQDEIFISSPTQKDCLDKFREALKTDEKLDQLLYLEKLGDLLLQDRDYITASLVLNSADVLAEKYQLPAYRMLVYKKLERIEGEFVLEKFGNKISVAFTNYLRSSREELASIRESSRSYLDQQVSMESLQSSLSDSFQVFFSNLVKHCFEMIGKPPPARFAVVGFGDLAMGEIFHYPSLAFGIFIEKDNPESRTYFQNFYQLIRLRILNLGETEHPLPSSEGVSSIVKRGIGLDQRLENFEMVTTPDRFLSFQTSAEFGRNPLKDQPWLESLCLYGDTSLHDQYQKDLQGILNQKRNLLSHKWRQERALKGLNKLNGEIAFLRNVRRIDLSQIYLEKDLYEPLRRAIHFLGLSYETKEKNIFGILKKLEREQVLSHENSQSLQDVLSQLIRLRVRSQLSYQKGDDISLLNLEKEGISSKGQILEIIRVLAPFYRACEDFTLNRPKVFAKSKFLDQGITI